MINPDFSLAKIIPEFGSMYPEKKQKSINLHTNQGLEFVYITKGEVSWQYDDFYIESKSGTVSFSWPDQVHGSAAPLLPASELHWIIIRLEENGSLPLQLGFQPKESKEILNRLKRLKPQILRSNRQIDFYFIELINHLHSTQNPTRFIQIPLLLKLLILEISNSLPIRGDDDLTFSETEAIVKAFIIHLEENCTDSWKLSDMCSSCQIGRTRFSSIVKNITGESPLKLLNRFRINLSKKLLIETNSSITDIAFDIGYPSSQYFSTVFKSYTGKSPSSFRIKNAEKIL